MRTSRLRHRRTRLWQVRRGIDTIADADFSDRCGIALVLDNESEFRVFLPKEGRSWGLGAKPPETEMRLIHWIRWMPDGNVLTVSASAGPDPTPEAWWLSRLWTSEGQLLRRLNFDSEMSNVLVTRSGRICVGYSDTGIFGGRGTGELAAAGLVSYDSEGIPRFPFSSDVKVAQGIVASFYSLCPAAAGGVWAWAYSDFQLFHIGPEGNMVEVVEVPKMLHGAAPVLVLDGHALFVEPWELDETNAAFEENENPTQTEEDAYFERMERIQANPQCYVWPLGGDRSRIRRVRLPPRRYLPLSEGQAYQMLDVQERSVFGIRLFGNPE